MTWTDAECDAYVDALPPYSLDYEVDPNASIRAELTAADKIIRAQIAEQIPTAVPIPWVTIYHGDETSSLATATYQDGWNAAVNAVLALLGGES